MATFYLFRIKVLKPSQIHLFEDDLSSSIILLTAIQTKPSAELRSGYIWHIGNLSRLNGDSGFYFALGRTTKSIVERYDEDEGNFLEEDFETSPYTHVFIDLHYQVIGIAKKTRLAPTPKGIANQLERLLNSSDYISSLGVRIEVSEINDPEDFVTYLHQAYSVTKFSVEFGEPNPWDADKDFQAPMQKLLRESSGTKGKTIIAGEDLERDTLEDLSRASASAGNDAQAVIKIDEDSSNITKHLKGNPATVTEEEVHTKNDKISILQKIVSYYRKIRQED